MDEKGLLYQAFVYLAAAVVSVPIAKKLGLGSVLGYLIAGMIIGPFVLQLVGEEGQDVMHFAEFGVVLMLFLIGLELKPALLWKLRVPILGLGGVQVISTALIIMLIGIFFGFTWQISLAIGLTLALSSTAIVLQTLSEKNLTNTVGGQNAFSVLLFQDIAVIPILAIIPLLKPAGTITPKVHGDQEMVVWTAGLPIWGQTLVVIAVIATIIFAGRFLINPLFRIIAKTRLREIFTAAALLLVIGAALLMTKVGLSPALGTFLAGVVLAQSEYRHELETDIEPFKGLLLAVFFIAVGASIDFRLIIENPWLITKLVITLILVKMLVLFITGRLFGLRSDHNMLFTFSLAQGGEFAFLLLSFAVQSQVFDNSLANPLIAAVAVSMAITPLVMLVYEKWIQPNFGTHQKPERESDEIDQTNPVIIAGFGRMGSVIGRFLQANGVQATYLDIDADNVDLLRKLGLKVFYGDASRADLLRAAGAEKARILVIAVDDADKGVEIAETAKKHFPQLLILSRAYTWQNAYELLDSGVEEVYKETFGTAMTMGVDTLIRLGFRAHQVNRASHRFMKHDYAAMREFAAHHQDHPNYIKLVKAHMEELEKLMLEERESAQRDKDLGWDSSSRIEEFGNPDRKL